MAEPQWHHLRVLNQLKSPVGVWQVRELGNPGEIYRQCMGMMARLAELGLVHCDFNEFNLLVSAYQQSAGNQKPDIVFKHPSPSRQISVNFS